MHSSREWNGCVTQNTAVSSVQSLCCMSALFAAVSSKYLQKFPPTAGPSVLHDWARCLKSLSEEWKKYYVVKTKNKLLISHRTNTWTGAGLQSQSKTVCLHEHTTTSTFTKQGGFDKDLHDEKGHKKKRKMQMLRSKNLPRSPEVTNCLHLLNQTSRFCRWDDKTFPALVLPPPHTHTHKLW